MAELSLLLKKNLHSAQYLGLVLLTVYNITICFLTDKPSLLKNKSICQVE